MIARLVVEDPARAIVPWWTKVPRLADKREIVFTPGINVLFGPNGSGKSTVLRTIARLTVCEQGGFSMLTETSIRPFLGRGGFGTEDPPMGVRVESDGQPVRFVDPSQRTGVVGGQIDWDVGDVGLLEAMAHDSAGQAIARRLTRVIGTVPTEVVDKVGQGLNSMWMPAKERALSSFEPKIPLGPTTLLLDEPDRSMDIPLQARLWREILPRAIDRKVQIIVATHCPFALLLRDAHWIETEPGYVERCRPIVAALARDLDTAAAP